MEGPLFVSVHKIHPTVDRDAGPLWGRTGIGIDIRAL
jgi:hypothetical protein